MCLWLSSLKFNFAFTQSGCSSLSWSISTPADLTIFYFPALAFLPKTPTLWVCLEHFISPMRAVHGKHRVMEWRVGGSIFKKFKTRWEDIFFWSSFPVCWHELKAHCPRKKMESSQIRKKKKAREVPQASGRSKCLANRWSYCSSLWDFQNPSEKKRKTKMMLKQIHQWHCCYVGKLPGVWHLEVFQLQVR